MKHNCENCDELEQDEMEYHSPPPQGLTVSLSVGTMAFVVLAMLFFRALF